MLFYSKFFSPQKGVAMDILSPPGTKVVFEPPKNGYSHEQELARKHLEIGGTYTVERVAAGDSSSEVFLCEVPGIAFNTVLFSQPQVPHH